MQGRYIAAFSGRQLGTITTKASARREAWLGVRLGLGLGVGLGLGLGLGLGGAQASAARSCLSMCAAIAPGVRVRLG